MEKLSSFIVKRRKIIFVVFIILTVLAGVAIPTVYKHVNSDLTTYLPDGTDTKDGQMFLAETFGIYGDCMIGIHGVSPEEMGVLVADLANIQDAKPHYDEDGQVILPVSQIIWSESDVFSMVELLQISYVFRADVDGQQIALEMEETLREIEHLLYDDGGTPEDYSDDNYVVLMTLRHGASSTEAFDVLTAAGKLLTDANVEHTVGGMTAMTKGVFDSTVYEVWKYTLVAMIIVIILLIICTESWAEPIILMITLGISVLINMGSNIILPSTSIITFSASAVLQLGLSMDYAIFFLHAVKEERRHTDDFNLAVQHSIPKTLKTVFASALTTAGGFLALFFMRFSIGADLGTVLAKGIVLSLLTVIVFQPALVILMRKPLEKWKHKSLNLHFRKPIKAVVKQRTAVVIAMLLLLLPIMLVQDTLNYGYLDFIKVENETPTKMDEMVDTASNQIVIAVPFDWEDTDVQYDFIEDMRALKNPDGSETVSFMLGLNSMLPRAVMQDAEVVNQMQTSPLSAGYIAGGYTMYTIGVTTDIEGEDTFNTLDKVNTIVKDNFGEDAVYYITGIPQAAKDFDSITPGDFTRVSLVSIAIIFVILLFSFRSLKYSALLVLIIQFGIWINLALQKILGTQINFMSYIIISSIQLGATVDYAILITDKYQRNRKKLMPMHAAYQATTSSVMSVLTSSAIMAGACFSVFFVTSNKIVAEITMLIARGSIISMILTLFVLPAILAYMDRPLPGLDIWKVEQQKKIRERAHRVKQFIEKRRDERKQKFFSDEDESDEFPD